MALVIGCISQKGGVGKSVCARLIAREYAHGGWNVKIADLDLSQGTSIDWAKRRQEKAIEPEVPVESFRTVEQALRVAPHYDLLVLDAPPHSTAGTKEIARAAHLLVLPTGLSLDDLRPSVLLAHELVHAGTSTDRIVFVLWHVGDREAEIRDARTYIEKAGYEVLKNAMPERTAYRRAIDEGCALSEVSHRSLRLRAQQVAQDIVNRVSTLSAQSILEPMTTLESILGQMSTPSRRTKNARSAS